MLTHSSILVWKIARIEKPGRLHFIGLKGHTQTRRKHESQMFHFPIGNSWNEKVKLCKEENAAESSGWKASKTRQFFLEYVFITQRQEDSVTLNYE